MHKKKGGVGERGERFEHAGDRGYHRYDRGERGERFERGGSNYQRSGGRGGGYGRGGGRGGGHGDKYRDQHHHQHQHHQHHHQQQQQQPQQQPQQQATSQDQSELNKGIYNNKLFTFQASAVIGTVMQVETPAGKIFEGVFSTWSPEFEVVLEQVHEVKGDAGESKTASNFNASAFASMTSVEAEAIKDKVVFPRDQIVRLITQDVDLEYAHKDGFQTDTQISGSSKDAHNGGLDNMRALEVWEPEDDSLGEAIEDMDLDGKGENGWSAEAMFRENRERYNVTTTFKSNLEGYTLQLKGDTNSKEYRDREAKASAIAREIEGTSSSAQAIELENGDEEEAFSAVQRPSDRGPGREDGGGSKYVPPARRQSSRGDRGGHQGSGPQQRMHQPRNSTSPAAPASSPMGHGYRDRGDADDAGGRGGRSGQPPFDGGRRGGPTHSYAHDQKGGGQRGYQPYHSTSPTERGHPAARKTSPTAPRDARKEAMAARNQPPTASASGGGQPTAQAPALKGPAKSQKDQISELKEFQRNFTLEEKKESPQREAQSGSEAGTTGGKTPTRAEHPAPVTPTQDPHVVPSVSSGAANPAPSSDPAPPVKSTLNPNAKEFKLNPNASVFVPSAAGRAPNSATPPARPQTPSAASVAAAAAAAASMPPNPAAMYPGGFAAATLTSPAAAAAHMMNPTSAAAMQYVATSAHYGGHIPASFSSLTTMAMASPVVAGGGPAGRFVHRGPGGQQHHLPRASAGVDLPSPLHVAGQPILAQPSANGPPPQGVPMQPGAPGGPPSNNYMGLTGAPHGQPQLVRMPPMLSTSMPPHQQQVAAAAFLNQQHQQQHQDQSGGPSSLPANAPSWAMQPPPMAHGQQQTQPQASQQQMQGGGGHIQLAHQPPMQGPGNAGPQLMYQPQSLQPFSYPAVSGSAAGPNGGNGPPSGPPSHGANPAASGMYPQLMGQPIAHHGTNPQQVAAMAAVASQYLPQGVSTQPHLMVMAQQPQQTVQQPPQPLTPNGGGSN